MKDLWKGTTSVAPPSSQNGYGFSRCGSLNVEVAAHAPHVRTKALGRLFHKEHRSLVTSDLALHKKSVHSCEGKDGTHNIRAKMGNTHEFKILPVNDCAPWIFSRFSANPMISQDPRGRGVPRRNEKEFRSRYISPRTFRRFKKYLLPISTASFERQKAP